MSFLLAIAAVLMEQYFWWFVAFTYAGLMAAVIDSLLEKPLQRARFIPAFFYLAVVLVFTFRVVRGSVYPEFTAQWTQGNYAPGTDIHGLAWQNGWSDLSFSIYNQPGIDLRDVDVEFSADQGIADAKLFNSVPCSIFQAGITAEMTVRSADGAQQLMHHLGGNVRYRILCDRLPADTTVRVAAAIVNLDSLMDLMGGKKSLTSILGPKRKPSVVRVHATYKAGLRPYEIDQQIEPSEY